MTLAEGLLRISWLGHATVLVELDGLRLLTDPVLERRAAHLYRSARVDGRALQRVDAVLISHGHWDHLHAPSLERVGREVAVVVPRGLGRYLRRRRFERVVEMDVDDELELGEVRVRATFAAHAGSRRWLGPKAPALGYVLAGSQRAYFAGDTGLFDGMAELAPLDLALLPVWGWGSRLPAGHLDPRGAADALRLLRPRVAVPIHWGTLSPFRPRNQDAWPAEEFRRTAAELVPGVDVRILRVGESLEL